MGRLYPILVLADIALMVVALIDCISSDDIDIRALPKFFWILLILLFSPIGPIVWFVAGRPQNATTGAYGQLTPGRSFSNSARRPRAARQVAPDDDPEFLRSLSRQQRDDEDLLRKWEADLRRREDELRRKENDDKPPA